MNIFSANIKSNPQMAQAHVESDIATAIRLGGIGFWQEIAPARYKEALVRHAAVARARVCGLAVECPVTVSLASWVVEGEPVAHLMHKGRLFVTPARYTLETRVHPRVGPQTKVCLLGTHFISGGWSNHYPLTKKWRRAQWEVHYAKLQALVAAAVADGCTVVVGMDANRPVTDMVLHPQQHIVSHHGIDGLIVVPGGGTTVTKQPDHVTTGLFTDHDPVSVTIGLTPASG